MTLAKGCCPVKGAGRWSEDGFNHFLPPWLAWVNGRFDALFLPEASPNR